MMEYTTLELIELLNLQDECSWIETKRGSTVDTSILETVCAYANEPGLGEGYILLGVEEDKNALFPHYSVCGVKEVDKVQKDLAPPTFESSRESNHFVARLLLHYFFLNEEDVAWLNIFSEFQLNDNQKKALVFVRETEAIDNQTYRQISGADVLKSSTDLRKLRDYDLLEAKGKGRATYYIPGKKFISLYFAFNSQSALVPADSTPVPMNSLRDELPEDLVIKIDNLKQRSTPEEVQELIHDLCKIRPYRLVELSLLIDRSPKYLLCKFIQPIMNIQIEYLYKDMVNHPNQAYVSI